MNHQEVFELLALYAVDALPVDEVAQVESHLAGCQECQMELDRYAASAAQLVPDSPAPVAVWDRIVAEVGEEPVAPPVPLPERSLGSKVWPAIAGIAAALALVFGGILVSHRSLDPAQALAQAAESAAQESNSIVSDFIVDDAAVAQLILTSDGRGFVVAADGLPALTDDRTYQLWVINEDGDVISAGVLGNDPEVTTFTWTGPVSGFALTREVAGGVVSSEGDVVSVITGL